MVLLGLVVICCVPTCWIKAQDYHYTQSYNTLAQESPAHVGNLDYDHLDRKYRFLALYRNQWRSVKSPYVKHNTPFETYRFSADGVVLIPGLLKTNYLGVGINVLRESAGDLNLTNQRAEIALSYNQRLDQKSFSYLCFALSPTYNQKSVALQNAYYDRQWNGRDFDPNLPTGEQVIGDRFTAFDLNTGLMYRRLNIFSKLNFATGVSVSNIMESRTNFVSTSNPLQRRFLIHGSSKYKLKPSRNLYFDTHYWIQGKLREFSLIGYKTVASVDYINSYTYLGIGLRLVGGLSKVSNDAMSLHFIQDYKDFRFSLSYDLNFSRLRQASSAKGGLEIGVLYYASRNNTRKKVPRKYKYGNTECPPHMKPGGLDFE